MTTKRNVVLIVLDSVRKDTFNRYATRIQQRSDIEFQQCRAASPWSVPSHASMFTGLMPSEHGIHAKARDFNRLGKHNTIFDIFPASRVFGVSSNPWLSEEFGFASYFEDLVEVSKGRRFPEGLNPTTFSWNHSSKIESYFSFLKTCLEHDYKLKSLTNGLLEKLDHMGHRLPIPKFTDDGASAVVKSSINQVKSIEEPFFFFINFMDTHGPYTQLQAYDRNICQAPYDWSSADEDLLELNINKSTGEEFLKWYRCLYRASVDYIDKKVCEFVDRVDQLTNIPTSFIITSDHGQNLGYQYENYQVGHFSSLSEGLLHVPLTIINSPHCDKSSINEGAQFSHLELKGFISEIYDGILSSFSESPINAELVSGGPLLDDINKSDIEQYEYWNRMQRTRIEGNNKIIWDSLGEVSEYTLDKNRDSWQQSVANSQENINSLDKYFSKSIQEFLAETETQSSGSQTSVKEQLSDLGYF